MRLITATLWTPMMKSCMSQVVLKTLNDLLFGPRLSYLHRDMLIYIPHSA